MKTLIAIFIIFMLGTIAFGVITTIKQKDIYEQLDEVNERALRASGRSIENEKRTIETEEQMTKFRAELENLFPILKPAL